MFRNRNELIFDFDTFMVELLGDQHLGKKFVSGVPLHRRGERETMQWHDFQESILLTTARMHVNMGDIFDNFLVSLNTILQAAGFYIAAALRNPGTTYVIIRGNHDMSRDKDKVSSFRLFKELVKPYQNIVVVDMPSHIRIDNYDFGFLPYDPFRTAEEQLTALLENTGIKNFEAMFGHWDLDSFGEMPHNMFPHELMSKFTGTAFTGHIHLPGERDYPNDLQLVVVGSMQPYNHSEDPERKLYVTLTLKDLEQIDPATLKDKCVRLVLAPDEEAPAMLDCLQYTTKRMDAPDEDESMEVVIEDFDFRQIIGNELTLQGVTETSVIAFVLSEYDRLRAEEANA